MAPLGPFCGAMMKDHIQIDTNAQLGSIIQRANAFVYRCRNDADYTMTMMTGAVEELTGHPAHAFLEPPQFSFSALYHPDESEALVRLFDRALERREAWQVSFRLRQPDGHYRWVHEVGGGVFDENDTLLFLEGIILDHEIRKRDEQAAQDLTEKIAAYCRDLVADTKPILGVLRELRILAINARIEAARAGQAGAGFAVVAGEVGRIANETGTRAARVADLTAELAQLLTRA
ncbi:MAG: PAS domain S-box protein [Rhodobacteraceae bacterium]|nr:PAS domain S-box protein [Paracoccaceae bacterium]